MQVHREGAVFGGGTLLVFDTEEAAAQAVAAEIAALGASSRFVLGLATGQSPVDVYQALIRLRHAGALRADHLTTFALDEYCGLAADDPRGFQTWLRAEVLTPLGVEPGQSHFPRCPSDAADERLAGREYESAIVEAGGIDLQILGIGRNGHIAFNEPGSSIDSRTRVVELEPSTREDAAAAFGGIDAVPTTAITMGIASIRDARRVRVLAFGAGKRALVERTLRELPNDQWPVSLLAGHPDVTLIADRAACPD